MIKKARVTLLSSIVAVSAILAACEAPKNYAGSYEMQHKIQVTEEVISVNLSVPTYSGTILKEEEGGFDRFARIFHLRAKSPITLFVNEENAGGEPRDAIIRRFVMASSNVGIRTDSIKIMPGNLGHEGDAPILATFEAYAAKAPECGDWKGRSTYRWANIRHENFGCAFQRNLALTVANPGDLVESQPMSSYGGQRGIVNVIGVESGSSGDAAAITE